MDSATKRQRNGAAVVVVVVAFLSEGVWNRQWKLSRVGAMNSIGVLVVVSTGFGFVTVSVAATG